MRTLLNVLFVIVFLSVLSLYGCKTIHPGKGGKIMIKEKGPGHPGKGKGKSKTMIKIQ
jgi:hypothetical protein